MATGIDRFPFSIAPLPDGRILVTEKVQGLSIVDPDGTRSPPLEGTPQTSDYGISVFGLDYGLGWLLDVAPHPDYVHNGWIYLLHTDLCADCRAGEKLVPATMSRLVRGHIDGRRWVDEEVIWSVPESFYSITPDIAAGGRVAFDASGYVYLSVGIKGAGNYVGIQDLATPYGKIHRVHDDGRIPPDNPFVGREGAMPSIWTYGHRSPQGLEFDPLTGTLWGTEMGPRGGDEVNRLVAGRNYFTPSPAISSFVVYRGDAFPGWQGDLIVGSLKATELYRAKIGVDGQVQLETLLSDLARIRDVEVDADGRVLLLLEHASGSRIVRLVPVDAS